MGSEPVAAAATAITRSRDGAEGFADAFADMGRLKDGSGRSIEADLRFRMTILEGSANPFLSALGDLIHASLQCAFRL